MDLLPIPISIQTPHRDLIYENKRMKELFGHLPRKKCYQRFNRDTPCNFCGLDIALETKEEAHFYVKTEINGKQTFLEVIYQPLYDDDNQLKGYVEIMHELPYHFLPLLDMANQLNEIPYSVAVLRFGKTGSEIIFREELPFPIASEEIEPFLTMMGVHWFALINQGNNINLGFFGPIPVTQHKGFVSYAALAKVKSNDADPRLQGTDLLLTLFFTNKKYSHLFNYHELFFDIIQRKYHKLNDVNELDSVLISELKESIISKWLGIFPMDFPVLVKKIPLL